MSWKLRITLTIVALMLGSGSAFASLNATDEDNSNKRLSNFPTSLQYPHSASIWCQPTPNS
jgi:hypothetical protein